MLFALKENEPLPTKPEARRRNPLPLAISALILASLACGGLLVELPSPDLKLTTPTPAPDCGAIVPDAGESCRLPNGYRLEAPESHLFVARFWEQYGLYDPNGNPIGGLGEGASAKSKVKFADGNTISIDQEKNQIIWKTPAPTQIP